MTPVLLLLSIHYHITISVSLSLKYDSAKPMYMTTDLLKFDIIDVLV